jgi:hypothetical protein
MECRLISDTSISSLPDSIGLLKNLRQLCALMNCRLLNRQALVSVVCMDAGT